MRRTGVALALAAAVLGLWATPALAANPSAVLDAPSTVGFGKSVALKGNRSFDPDTGGSIVQYRWTVDSRATVNTTVSSFDAPAGTPPLTLGRHTATLVVVDNNGNLSSPASRDFFVVDDVKPTAVLDVPATVPFNTAVALDGTRSSDAAPGSVEEWRWTVDSRTVVVTADPTFDAPAGTPPLALGRHTAKLVVVDDAGNESEQVSQEFTVVDTQRPTAVLDAPATVGISDVLPLSGARSADTGGGRVVEWRWTVGTRDVVVTDTPTFSSPAGLPVGRTTVSLRVVDDSGNVSSSTAAQVIVLDDVAPTAVIDAPSSVALGDAITVSGSRSTDVGGTVKVFQWTVDGGTPRNQAEPALNVGVLAGGRHTVTLKVTDDAGNESAVTTVSVFVGDDIAPTAVLDVPATVRVGASVPLAGGRSSDVRGRIVRYRWTIDGGSAIDTADAAFTAAPLPLGRHTVALVVTDDSGNESAADTRTVIVIDDVRPTAILDAPATAVAGAAVTLSGARSSDVGGRIVRFRWTVDARPPVDTQDPSFTAAGLSAGTHTVSLVVTDDSGNESAPDTRTIVVPATPPSTKPPTGTKLTTFGKVTLLAPAGKKTALIDLRKGTLTLGRLFSTGGGTFKATLSAGRLKLGTATAKLRAGGVASLTAKLPAAARKTLKGKKKVKVTVKAGGVTRALTVTVT